MCAGKNVRVRVGLSVIAPKSGSQPEDWRPNPADDLWAGSRSGQPEPAGSRNWNWRITGAGRQPHPAADGTDRRPNPANDLRAV